MDAESNQDLQVLLAELAQARERQDGLLRDLAGVDGELEALSVERRQYHLLHEVCNGLEQLRELGGAELFWGDRAATAGQDAQLRRALGRAEAFQKVVGELEERRETLLDEIEQQQRKTGLIEDDVFEAERQEERRRHEWIIEREIDALPEREMVMPWTRGGEADERFRKMLRATLAVYLLLILVVPWIELPVLEVDPEHPAPVPERLVRLMMESRPLPPTPAREQVKPEPIPRPVEQVAEPTPPQRSKPSDGPGKGSGEGPGEGPGKGTGKGILAFREQFSGVEETQSLARLGSHARIRGDGSTGPAQRSMVTTRAPGSSGGIDLASLSRGVGGGAGNEAGGRLSGVQVARATSTIAAGGSGGLGDSVGGGGATPGRTDEEIQIVFDRHKASLYRLYNRELRRDPTLKGQMILRMTIEPDGNVSLCLLHGSDMNAPQLAAQVVDRVRTFDFGAKEGIAAVTILYPIDFLPAA